MQKVYLDYDQAGLNLQYDNQANVPDPRRHLEWYDRVGEEVRRRVPHEAGIAYGPLPDQKLDILAPPSADGGRRPVVVFIHGGAWKALGRRQSAFAADTFTRRGAIYVALGFGLLPAAGTLDEMVAQVRTGIAWLHRNVRQYGGDPGRLHVVGHSSGAHLAAMACVTDWRALHALPSPPIRSAALLSGLYDLEPVRLSSRNEMLRLDRAAELRNSPVRNLPNAGLPILVAVGEKETSEFKRQAEVMHSRWRDSFGNSRWHEAKGLNHFETAECLADPPSPLTELLLEHFGLTSPL